MVSDTETDGLIRRAAASSVASLFLMQVRTCPDRVALVDGGRKLTYRDLAFRVSALAGWLERRRIAQGKRVAILSENRLEYLELFLAAAWNGAIVACQNWRLATQELAHCLSLVEPEAILVSPRHAERLSQLPIKIPTVLTFGPDYEAVATGANATGSAEVLDPETPLLILYTSGTTGLPKGAVISHRAEIARNMVLRAEFGIAAEDAFVAWSPLYHMGAAEFSLGTLMSGGTVFVVDGFDVARLIEIVATERIGWLLLMPGMVGRFAAELKRAAVTVQGVKVCGVMADLVPPAEIAEVTTLLNAPYANTFGATETGCPPCSSNLIPVGVAPARLSKQQSPFCEVRLVNAEDNEVPDGKPGELCMRGPTLFSGYWRAPETNGKDFRGGWFHMGDVFVRNPDGTLDFVDRVKYLIKSGGENIYPAEIERVLLQDKRVADAAVVRKRDPKWGEVPVAFVARHDDALTEDDLRGRCRAQLAGFKQPKEIHFIPFDAFPRSASGKIQRHELEQRLREP
ncbi:MAG TPA: class I adenylate-forming enzyme family protein [Dongiaceae bacterium]|nr:class I adenylate-forming enzyme family protein [Dongiaceae bacterium]